MLHTLGRMTLLGCCALTLGLTFAGPAPAQFGGTPTKKTVSTFTSGGQKIGLWTYEPKAVGKYPAVVMLHGIEALEGLDKFKTNYDFVAHQVAGKGYVVCLVHYFDRTRRPGEDLKALETSIKTMLVGGTNTPRDEEIRQLFRSWMGTAADAIKHARSHPNADPERVALVGFSLGGYVAVSTLVTEPNLGVGAVVEFFGGLPKELHAKMAKMPPMLVFHGDKDSIVPVKEAHDLIATMKAAKNFVEPQIWEGVDHMFLGDNMQIRLDLVMRAQTMTLTFLEKQLGKKKN